MTFPMVTPYFVALRFVGLKEKAGAEHSAGVLAMLQLDDRSIRTDETPWCSAFVNYIAWLLGLPRSKSLAARSWLTVGQHITMQEAKPGSDIVVLSRGPNAPPASVRHAPGHVGFFVSVNTTRGTVRVLGGNQSDQVCVEDFPLERVLDVRRLA